MAIGTPTERRAVFLGSQTTSSVVSPSTTVTAGTVAILCAASSAKLAASITDDTAGGLNTWIVDRTYTGNGRSVSFASCQIVTQILNTDVITITWDVATSTGVAIWVEEITGLATSSVFDTSATGTSASTTTPATSATATLAQADEIVFAGFRASAASSGWVKGASYTNATTPILNSNCSLEYKIVAATTGVVGDGTFSPATSYAGVVATYKGLAGNTYEKTGFGALGYLG